MRPIRLLLTATALALASCDYSAPDEVTSGVIVYTQPLEGASSPEGFGFEFRNMVKPRLSPA